MASAEQEEPVATGENGSKIESSETHPEAVEDAVQESPGVSASEAVTTLPPLAAEEVQAEIQFGEAQPEPVSASRRSSELPALKVPVPKVSGPSRAQLARQDARRRIIQAREELERRVAEATEARLRKQAEQEQFARQRAEEAQQRAKKRLQRAKKAESSPSTASASAPDSARSPSPGRGEALPGLKPAKVRVRKKILKQRQEQEQRLREIEEDRKRLELRKKAEMEAAEVHRLEAAKRAALRFRQERLVELRKQHEHEEELRQARERQKLYRNPREIAKVIAEAQVQSQVQERRRSAQHEESHLQRERERARRVLDGEEEERLPFGAKASKTRGESPEDPWDENLLAKTVQALTDEDWKVNIKFS